jgi:hypothetical protein
MRTDGFTRPLKNLGAPLAKLRDLEYFSVV